MLVGIALEKESLFLNNHCAVEALGTSWNSPLWLPIFKTRVAFSRFPWHKDWFNNFTFVLEWSEFSLNLSQKFTNQEVRKPLQTLLNFWQSLQIILVISLSKYCLYPKHSDRHAKWLIIVFPMTNIWVCIKILYYPWRDLSDFSFWVLHVKADRINSIELKKKPVNRTLSFPMFSWLIH